jgi:WD40 repeat protein
MSSEDEFFDAAEELEPDPIPRKSKRERYYTVNEAPAELKVEIDFSLISSVKSLDLPISSSYWLVRFSPDGGYVSIAGSSNIILLFRLVPEKFLESPLYLNEHTYDITSLSWSRNQTFLSSSIDHTVKEWKISPNSINTLNFHCRVSFVAYLNQDANFFVAAFEDFVIRVVHIQSKAIVHQVQLFESITALAVSQSGRTVAVGMNRGRVVPFTVRKEDLKLLDRNVIKAKNARGLKKSGKKVTGLFFLNDEEVLITTLDSNIRLYSLVDFQMKQKYKGGDLKVKDYCAEATYDSDFVICGGDSGKFYIWGTVIEGTKNRKFETVKVNKQKTPVYVFLAPLFTLNIFKQGQENNSGNYAVFCLDTGNTLNIYLM